MPADARPVIPFGPFLTACLAAPGSALVVCLAGAAMMDWPASLNLGMILPLAGMILLVTAWGLAPAVVFGALVLWPLERFRRTPAPASVLVLAGLAASAVYVATCWSLIWLDQGWAFIIAPWALFATNEEGFRGNQSEAAGIYLSILASGFIAGLIYARASGRLPLSKGRATREPSHAPPPRGL